MRVLLNGVGRIGKSILKIALEENAFDIIAINELNSNIKNIAYSINYDSTYGRFDDKFTSHESYIQNSNKKIEILNKKSFFEIDFAKLDIDVIVDASGSKIDINELKKLPVKAIFLTHPNKNADINVIMGINSHELCFKEHKVISTSSCNATALLPALKIIDEHFGIECGEITTIHPFLNHQKLLDSGCIGSFDRNIECNFEFGRSATQNIIPSKTTTIEACSYILPHINSSLISSASFRVPTATVGVIDTTIFTKKETTKEAVINLFKEYEQNQSHEILLNNFEELVSSDFKALHYTTIVDHRFNDVRKGKMVKLAIWYDNEWGYASKVVSIIQTYQ